MEEREGLSGGARIVNRAAALGALALAALTLAALLLGGGDGYQVTVELSGASQLVEGNQVTVGGLPAGSVEEIELGDDGTALVTLSVDERYAPLPAGTAATVRSVSLASIAGRRVELTIPAGGGGAAIPDGGRIGLERSFAAVEIDQLFNTLDDETVRDLKHVIQGFERAGRGTGREANRGFRYLNPLLSGARRVLGELRADRGALEQLLVDTSRLSGALAERAPEVSALVRNLSVAAGAIGRQRAALAEALALSPAFLRRSNTTFVNLRAAIADLEPLVAASAPVAERLGPFLARLRTVARRAVPAVGDLDALVRREGADNDLTELLRLAVPLAAAGAGSGSPECGGEPATEFAAAADEDFTQGALGETACALRNSLPVLSNLRAYTPELVGWFDDFSASGTLDANGGIGRIAGTFNAFSQSADNGLPELLSPVDATVLFGTGGSGPLVDVGNDRRCPGANERDPGDGSVPFTDGGAVACDPAQIATGP